MNPTEPNPLTETFDEGMRARRHGKARTDNPYSAGSSLRREWNAGFCATVEREDDDELGLGADDGAEIRTVD